MLIRNIIDKETKEKTFLIKGGDVEKINPIEYYINCLHTMVKITKYSEISEISEIIKEFRSVEIPENLINLLSTTKKKEQEKLLKGLRITPDILMSFLIYVGDKEFLFSQYSSKFYPKGTDEEKLPFAFMENKDGAVKKFGDTKLTDKQLKHILNERNVKIAKFIEKDNMWHCFFITYKSIRGKEKWEEGQPHFHYISNFFGISKENVIKEIKSEKYNLGNLPHIALCDYGVQPN